MREIVLDTETTGLEPAKGDRMVEIGAIEIVNQIETGTSFHVLVNPERDVSDDAFRVHGHTTGSLRDKPVFSEAARAEFMSCLPGLQALGILSLEMKGQKSTYTIV